MGTFPLLDSRPKTIKSITRNHWFIEKTILRNSRFPESIISLPLQWTLADVGLGAFVVAWLGAVHLLAELEIVGRLYTLVVDIFDTKWSNSLFRLTILSFHRKLAGSGAQTNRKCGLYDEPDLDPQRNHLFPSKRIHLIIHQSSTVSTWITRSGIFKTAHAIRSSVVNDFSSKISTLNESTPRGNVE